MKFQRHIKPRKLVMDMQNLRQLVRVINHILSSIPASLPHRQVFYPYKHLNNLISIRMKVERKRLKDQKRKDFT